MFVGRKCELAQLENQLFTPSASLVVVKGKRRIGKSRLIKEFAKPYKTYSFMGLAPGGFVSAQDQRNEFSKQFKAYFSSEVNSDDWGDLFRELATRCKTGRVIIVLDEISWMATGDGLFLGKLKNIWDMYFTNNPDLILFLCGSVSAWIEKNILSNTGFLGRPSMHMTIEELPIEDCLEFWRTQRENISPYEILKVLAVTGGVPRYLELINPKLSAEENIKLLCFNKNSPLFDEFKYIFSDIYQNRSLTYQKIIEKLEFSKASRAELILASELNPGGDISEYLNDLETGGFITKEYTWDIKAKRVSRLHQYRLCDNYARFYLNYILPNFSKIKMGQFEDVSITNIPGWNTILALQFENLVVNNAKRILKILGIKPEELILNGPYFQRKTTRQPGCQIDFLIQTRHDVVYVCEIKFKRTEIGMEIIEEVKEKIKALKVPKYVSRRAVLIHVNGVKDSVLDAGYFTSVVDFSEFFNASN